MAVSISSPSDFTYDAKSMRYRSAFSGRYIAAGDVRSAVDTIIDKETVAFRSVAQQLIDGSINLAEFQLQMQANVKRLNVAMGLAASGGVNNASASDLGYLGGLIKGQYQYLRSMAKQIKNGAQPLDGTLLARAGLYAQSSRGTFEDMRRRQAKQADLSLERRDLGAADHCQFCLEQNAMGWQPIGTLNAIGDSPCGGNCHCSFIYRTGGNEDDD
jgi:hypothetical protein